MSLVTKSQLLMLFNAWDAQSATVPTKRLQTIIAFPRSAKKDFNSIFVKKTDFKATYGGPLFSIEFKNL